jgi:hypothetical protein
MKKLSILLLSVLFIGTANLSAQTDATEEIVTSVEELKDVKTCAKTGKICEETCKNKENDTCCKGKKIKKGSFNFAKSNNYIKKSSCSKDTKKSCCKKKASNNSSDSNKDIEEVITDVSSSKE